MQILSGQIVSTGLPMNTIAQPYLQSSNSCSQETPVYAKDGFPKANTEPLSIGTSNQHQIIEHREW